MKKRTEEELLARDRAKVAEREAKIAANKARESSKEVRDIEHAIRLMDKWAARNSSLRDAAGHAMLALVEARSLALSGPGGAKQ